MVSSACLGLETAWENTAQKKLHLRISYTVFFGQEVLSWELFPSVSIAALVLQICDLKKFTKKVEACVYI